MHTSTDLKLITGTDFVTQSTLHHVAIIMDGNRRWARERGLAVSDGHRAGIARLRELLPVFVDSDIRTLTLFAFSSANWQRPQQEVSTLLRLAGQALSQFSPVCRRHQIAVEVIGRRDRLPGTLLRNIEHLVRVTAGGKRKLRIALDYSSRAAIIESIHNHPSTTSPDRIGNALSSAGDVDLLIRTGKEQRLSDFLLWECAFAELLFPDVYWPDFDEQELHRAIDWFSNRQRRYGS
jgi:undecaprenyl diphosphate synthase